MRTILATTSVIGGSADMMKPALMVLFIILAVLLLSTIIFTVLSKGGGKRLPASRKLLLSMMYLSTAAVLVCTIFCTMKYNAYNAALRGVGDKTSLSTTTENDTTSAETEEPTTVETTEATVPAPTYTATMDASADPKKWNINWKIYEDKTQLESYTRNDPISFGDASTYSQLPGVLTFRGDNYRTGPTYGTTNIVNKTLEKKWSYKVGGMSSSAGGFWSGTGWTGQPVLVQWDDETRQIMNLYDDKKAKDGLVEVIYATMDGHIYFCDIEDGSFTRPKINMGMTFKGSGSLDPRGYPLFYVGSGDNTSGGKAARMYIVNLITGEIIWEHSGKGDVNTRKWYAFDSAPLVDAETDTMVWPGENGVLYTMKLNTAYDKTAGTIAISPDPMIKNVYSTNTGRSKGAESSAIIVDRYCYFGDNGGLFFCVDLDTMALVWCQNTLDDVNATPVFEWADDGKGYIYTGNSMEYANGKTHLHKLDAATGEIVWEVVYDDVAFNKDVSGGVLSSVLLGKKGTDMEGLVIYSISRTPSYGKGILVALDTKTGEKVWEVTMNNYCWSSPAGIYTAENKGYIIQCDSAGKVFLIDGKTGEKITYIELGSNIEASPAIFENRLVVGTRGGLVCGVEIN